MLILTGQNPIMDKEPALTDEQILETPSLAFPGGLSRLWSIRAGMRQQRELTELAAELSGTSPRHFMIFAEQDPALKRKHEEDEHRRAMQAQQELREYEDRREYLLARITQEQQYIEQRCRQIDEGAIRLDDGRRAYVDGDRYRDAQGTILKGRDHDEAEGRHRDRPQASTWKDKQEIEARARDEQALKDKVERDGEGTTAEKQQRLTLYEKEFAEKIDARTKEPRVDYGNADYMSAADDRKISSAPAFAAAAEPVLRETIGKLTEDDNASQAADMKKPPRPLAGNGIKPA
jgi:hypothetical protein